MVAVEELSLLLFVLLELFLEPFAFGRREPLTTSVWPCMPAGQLEESGFQGLCVFLGVTQIAAAAFVFGGESAHLLLQAPDLAIPSRESLRILSRNRRKKK